MNIQDRITDLFSKGVKTLEFAIGEGGVPVASCLLLLRQGEWQSRTTLEAVGPSHVDALNLLAEKVDCMSKMAPPSRIVKLNGN